ncbi:Uncharacterized protein HZ326_28438 [Fusarium oxysporum f. sp. albedinis]|nr:Uncharacterized protein HZ326_28438 [Fusarium oxysporum f. sp. albedinis]
MHCGLKNAIWFGTNFTRRHVQKHSLSFLKAQATQPASGLPRTGNANRSRFAQRSLEERSWVLWHLTTFKGKENQGESPVEVNRFVETRTLVSALGLKPNRDTGCTYTIVGHEHDTLVLITLCRRYTTWERRGDGEFAEVLSRELLEDAPEDTLVSHSTAGRPYSLLLRKWLWDCDQNHIQCERPQRKQIFWPKRVIFVGDSNKLVLVEDQLHGEDYLVLSHCWGRPTVEEKKLFCTTRENYKGRLHKSFSYDELPRTFQDAVRVTRLLGKQYLWIDAICIIQGPDGDWETEARTMEDIFASAYCTIAASSAGGWGDGFLQPDLDSHHIGMQGIPSTPICACDFERDVDERPLVKRAWVLQERVLSRRIIHFAATHTYWECGKGVRCIPGHLS